LFYFLIIKWIFLTVATYFLPRSLLENSEVIIVFPSAGRQKSFIKQVFRGLQFIKIPIGDDINRDAIGQTIGNFSAVILLHFSPFIRRFVELFHKMIVLLSVVLYNDGAATNIHAKIEPKNSMF
jgi:hypothetical protein